MATRTIVTSQPDVACDVCARRLLRGEQPDVFLGAGRRRIVCELCAPRAAHEGWMRETDGQSLTPAADAPAPRARPVRAPAPGRQASGDARQRREGSPDERSPPYDLFAESAPASARPDARDAEPLAGARREPRGTRRGARAGLPQFSGRRGGMPARDPEARRRAGADGARSRAASGELARRRRRAGELRRGGRPPMSARRSRCSTRASSRAASPA